jgi:multidrug resistance efflux pump
MHKKRALIPIVLVVLAAGGWWLAGRPDQMPDWLAKRLGREPALPAQAIAGSGNIEAETVVVSAESAGRIVELTVDEGDSVVAGQVMVRLDPALIEAQIRQAEAGVAAARARLDQVRAGPSAAELHQAEVAVAQARTARDVARQALDDASLARDNPQQLDARIVAARNDLAAAEAQVRQATAARDAAQARRDQVTAKFDALPERMTIKIDLPTGEQIRRRIDNPALDAVWTQVEVANNQWWGAWEGLLLAQAVRDGAQRTLAALLDLREHPLAADAQVHAAEARQAQAEADVAIAQAALADLAAGPTAGQIAVAEAQVRQAEAAVNTLRTQFTRMTLTAPRDGLVTRRARQPGEMAAPGAALLTLADLDQVRLVIYVPETQIGQVQPGQSFAVTVDSFPGRTFTGHVTYISPQAEFTPKNVQTREARVNQVFAVRLALDNPEHLLKPGMPADAVETTADSGPQTAVLASLADERPTTNDQHLRSSFVVGRWSVSGGRQSVVGGRIEASGSIEATEYAVTAEVAGRVQAVLADEGQEVQPDQVVIRLDPELLQAQVAQAQADLAVAEAQLALARSGARPGALARARATVAKAVALRDAAVVALQDAQAVREQPQDLDLQLVQARNRLAAAAHQVEAARAQLAAAEALRDGYKNPSDEYYLADQQVQVARAAFDAAVVGRKGAEAGLAQLLAMRQNPLDLDAKVHAAQGQVDQAEQAVAAAQAALDTLESQPRPEAVAVADAQVQVARAALDALQVRLDKLVLRAPASGLVTRRAVHEGEAVTAGAPLLTVAAIDQVRLTVYIPEAQVGQVRLGQPAEVRVDSFPGRSFTGQVVYISPEAEFTPKNVQTKDARTSQVFAVKIALDNPEHWLKPGMPADAVIGTR